MTRRFYDKLGRYLEGVFKKIQTTLPIFIDEYKMHRNFLYTIVSDRLFLCTEDVYK